jgi:hypothetical protein
MENLAARVVAEKYHPAPRTQVGVGAVGSVLGHFDLGQPRDDGLSYLMQFVAV